MQVPKRLKISTHLDLIVLKFRNWVYLNKVVGEITTQADLKTQVGGKGKILDQEYQEYQEYPNVLAVVVALLALVVLLEEVVKIIVLLRSAIAHSQLSTKTDQFTVTKLWMEMRIPQ